MRRTIILCLLALFTICSYGQKKINDFTKDLNSASLQTKSDSLSYALGQAATGGLKSHLINSDVLEDSTATDFDKKAYEYSLQTFIEGLIAAINTNSPKDNKYNTGIAIGSQLAIASKQFEEQVLEGENINKEIFIRSIVSSLYDKPTIIDNPNAFIEGVAMEKQQAEQIKAAEELKELHGERISEGVKFLAKNKLEDGVKTLPSGLQYRIIEEGAGVMPLSSDKVTVHYEGRLLDGTVFDSSYKRGDPTSFGVTQVIKGWTEALQIMPVGSKWTIYVPHDLAYGERDSGTIPPFSTLVFDIELIEIVE